MAGRGSWRRALLACGVLFVLMACTNEAAETAAESGADPAAAQPAAQQPAQDGESRLDQIQESGTLRVGMTLRFPPQSYLDENDEPAGYDIELLEVMAEDLGVELEIIDQEFDALIPGLLAGNFDMIASGMGNTPERAKAVWFSPPYIAFQQLAAVNADAGISSLEDLNQPGRRITALVGSTAAELVRNRFPEAELVELEQQPAFLEVVSGRADAVITESFLALGLEQENPDAVDVLDPENPLEEEFGHFVIPQGDLLWKEWVSNWVIYQQDRGLMDRLFQEIMVAAPSPS
jgi:polar amino acid transport system substrate-binding protein